jgi:hypothetical protein
MRHPCSARAHHLSPRDGCSRVCARPNAFLTVGPNAFLTVGVGIWRPPLPTQVREFSELVARACNEGESAIAYEPCSEHAHSNCMLLGHPSMKQGGGDGEAEFATWIDYARFHQLVSSGEPFTAADYMAPTPEWACYRTEYTGKSAGFDPAETRWHRHSGVALSKCHLRVIIIVIGTLD